MYEYEKRKFKKYIGNDLYNILKTYNCIVAGGSILSIFANREINDIDVYFRSKRDLADFLYNEMNDVYILAKTDKALLFKYQGIEVQAIYFQYFDNAKAIFDTFDFTVCMCAFDFKSEEIVLHKDFLRHNVSKILKFNQNTSYPLVSAMRVSKYKNKGYEISKPEYIKILLCIMNLKIDNYEDLKEQMGGMYGENYDTLLKNEDGEEFNLVKVIDNISRIGEEDIDFKLYKSYDFNDFDEMVYEITGEKIKYFEYNNKNYRYLNGDFEEIRDLTDVYEIKEINDVVKFPIYRYKYVGQKDDGTLYSYYDKNYIWVIGENLPKNKEMGLFACKSKSLETSTYSNKNDKVCLEVIIESIDDIKLNNSREGFNRLVATRLVPKDEVEKLVKKECIDDDYPFA